jgi:hypothetical protein
MKRYLVGMTAAFVLAGCASSPQERPADFWYVNSSPAGAVVTTSDGLTCVTPCRLEVKRWRKKDDLTFTYAIQKDGFETIEGTATIRTNPAEVGALAVGAVLTAATGVPIFPPVSNKGAIMIDPNPLALNLTPTVATPN